MIIPQPNTNLILNGDSLQVLKELPENSIDSVVTDPPYGLSFMGKKWDYDVPSVDLWKEIFRVMKPGAFLLSFAGTRTYHRMAVNIEDAGFEIRDMISWLYGSGFPKSLNIGKQVDKIQGNEREITGYAKSNPDLRDVGRQSKENCGIDKLSFGQTENVKRQKTPIDKGNSQFEGFGTALKPACEPIVVARKPLSEKNVALNVLKWGTGGINIDDCRVGKNGGGTNCNNRDSMGNCLGHNNNNSLGGGIMRHGKNTNPSGRFPANIILDNEAGSMLDEQSGYCGGNSGGSYDNKSLFFLKNNKPIGYKDKGGASRFFYCAKASKSERNFGCEELGEGDNPYAPMGINTDEGITQRGRNPENQSRKQHNNHPTVKPLKLMQYLVRLVTPKGGVCLDPFLGSGTTACACIKEGMNYIGIEKEEDYIKIANARIKAVEDSPLN